MTSQLPAALVSTEWLAEQLEDQHIRILDCSQVMTVDGNGTPVFQPAAEQWQQAHIPGSIYIDVLKDFSVMQGASPMMPDAVDFMARMQAFGIGDDSTVIVYDRGNHAWAARVWWMFRVCGFHRVAVLNGGWKKWCADGNPLSSENTAYPPATSLQADFRREFLSDKQDVLSSLHKPGVVLLNSLPRPMFTGELAAFGRPGRIPGSKHLFCESLLDPGTNCFLPEAELRGLCRDAGLTPGDKVIPYCGGGIAASSNALILTVLGFRDVALYDGSLAEWAADTQMPMEAD